MPIFDDWEDVKECDDCERYYNSQCDGMDIGKKRKCTQFVATRSRKFEDDLRNLERECRRLKWYAVALNAFVITFLVSLLVRWLL